MNILLDNIIFSLQKAGGASVVWQQHLERLLQDKAFQCRFLEYDNAELNLFRQQLSFNKDLIDLKSSKFLSLKRFLNFNSKNEGKHLFHSSHYRLEECKNAINVTTVHDFTYEYFRHGIPQKIHSWQKYKAINGSEGVICISNSTKDDLIKFLPNFDKSKIRVIYNGVDEGFKLLDSNINFDKKHYFEDYRYALYVGDRRSTHKNFNMAVDACSSSNIPLLLIGGGVLNEVEKQMLDSKLGKSNYQCITEVSVEDLNYYYNRAFCLLYPSLYEGFGIPIIEAQRAGCPVIATRSSSIPEVLGNSYLAIESPTFEKISQKFKELASTSDLRKESIELGFEKAKQFSWQNTYDHTIEFYKELYFKK
ncbi:glycosyltransferase family 4 protein [Flavobacterium sp. XS2P39]|uniref:glycosyltransferase family 4 protein n=1 Tax=Flavobacterium sp. XS2P39 TaxID=3401725 RepID=UPI003AAD8E46